MYIFTHRANSIRRYNESISSSSPSSHPSSSSTLPACLLDSQHVGRLITRKYVRVHLAEKPATGAASTIRCLFFPFQNRPWMCRDLVLSVHFEPAKNLLGSFINEIIVILSFVQHTSDGPWLLFFTYRSVSSSGIKSPLLLFIKCASRGYRGTSECINFRT